MQTIIYDPTAADAASSVRGIGRYVQLLRENLSASAALTASLKNIPRDSTFIVPFLNITQPPFLRRRLARRQIAVLHDLIPLKYPKDFPLGFRGFLNVLHNKYLLKNYDIIVTDSESSKVDIISMLKVRPEKIHVIYPCMLESFSNVKPDTKHIERDPYFIYVGDATPNKNLVRIARAIQATQTKCVFVGKVFEQTERSSNAWNKELNDLLALTKGDDHFIFSGFVSDEELLHMYKSAIANILLSKDEGFGFSYLEAANCKVPSILSDIPVFHEIAGDSALFANPSNLDEIVTTLKLFLSENKFHHELGNRAYNRSKYFTPEKFRKSWEAVLLKKD